MLAEKPFVPQPGLFPEVMSLKTAAALLLYNSGFRNPSTGFPALRRWSLASATMLAKVGLDALVPPTRKSCPATLTTKFVPWAATSGNPRPEALYKPE